ncbi:MAG TPA: hypothetical protein VF771_02375, partial [Longimicrobiaceae bacterium]
GQGNAPFRFAPEEGPGFFARFGWREAEWRSTLDEARRLKREMPLAAFYRLLLRLASERRREEARRFSMYLLLERT